MLEHLQYRQLSESTKKLYASCYRRLKIASIDDLREYNLILNKLDQYNVPTKRSMLSAIVVLLDEYSKRNYEYCNVYNYYKAYLSTVPSGSCKLTFGLAPV